MRVGEVCGVDGRRIYVLVDRNKNLSDMFLDGDILKNISVNSYIEIRKGFLSIIGRVEGEKVEPDLRPAGDMLRESADRYKRILTVSLSGYINEAGVFQGGTRELPLIGNEAYIVTREKVHQVHNLARPDEPSITVATIFGEDFEIKLPIDGLFNSHIAIFGNTGSGKSNTLAILYQELVSTLAARNVSAFRDNAKFVLFDFNGEYAAANCITSSKKVYHLSTREDSGDKMPISSNALMNIETFAILADATEKTQKPFMRRALRLFKSIEDAGDPTAYCRAILQKRIRETLQMSDKARAHLLIDYFREILDDEADPADDNDIIGDLEWHNMVAEFFIRSSHDYLRSNPVAIAQTRIYERAAHFEFSQNLLSNVIACMYIQMITDVLANRAQNEHIAPVINRLKSKRQDIERLFDLDSENSFWGQNFVVVNLDDVNLDMKKTIPLLLSKHLYADQKKAEGQKTLNIIIDEAHNILSTESFREAESWKDYRLETFEEIIKEGRKFGVFVTIASQRPNDISPTITSQAHNYFVHRLINERDLQTMASAVSYIDRVTEESIPTLPTGTCIFSGVASQMPLKINIMPLSNESRPRSATRSFATSVPSGASSSSVVDDWLG